MGAYVTWGNGGQFEFDVVLSETHEGIATITDHPIEKGAAVSDHAIPQVFRCTVVGVVTNTPINHAIKPGTNEDIDAIIYRKAYFSKRFSVDVPRFLGVQPFAPTGIINAVSLADNENPTRNIALTGQDGSASLDSIKLSAIKFDSEFDRRTEVMDVLEGLRLQSTLCTVYTPIRVYTNMLIEKYSAPRTAESGGSLTVSIDFRQVRIVESRTVVTPKPKAVTGQKKTEKGRVEPVPAPAPEEAVLEPKEQSRLFALLHNN